ncbi:MAG: RIP metalloprotease RseP [Acidobacteriaceae bacterium]
MSFFLTSTVSMLVVLGIMVLVHEFGHFAVAKLCGVRVEVFSIGFGKRLFGFRRGDTDYRLSLLPLGGYVKMSGESPGEVSTGDPAEFNAHPRWQRMLIGLAGPVSNFLLALLLMTGFYMMHNEVEAFRSQPANIDFVSDHTAAAAAGLKPGDLITRFDSVTNPTWEQVSIRSAMNVAQTIPVDVKRDGQIVSTQMTIPQPRGGDDFDFDTVGFVPRMQEDPIRVRQIEAGMPAAKAGLKAGDQILSVDGLTLHSVDAMLAFLQQGNGRPIQLSALRDGKTFQVELQPIMADEPDGRKLYRIGFAPNLPPFKIQQLPLPAALKQSVRFNLRYSGLIIEVLQRMVTRRFAVQDLSGPIGIARETGLAVQQPGWQPIIGLMSIISLNLGIFNLLPIPILDGGVIALLLIEGVMRRDLNPEFRERIYQAAFVVLLIFAAFVMFNDISKLQVFSKLKP